MINNLIQLKDAMDKKMTFVIVKHYIHPNCDGQIRIPTVVHGDGFFSIEKDKPNSEVSAANDFKGRWFEYGRSSDCVFDNGLCRCAQHGRRIWDIKVLEENLPDIKADYAAYSSQPGT